MNGKKGKISILGVTVNNMSRNDILEEIKKYVRSPVGFFHIVSLNPENLVVSKEDNLFKQVLEKAQIKIIDGAGVVLAARILGVPGLERLTGVSLMQDMLRLAARERLRVLFLGGKPNLADALVNCYSKQYPEAKFVGEEGIREIQSPEKEEERYIFSIVADYKPHIMFASFGSPYQELWLWRNRARLQEVVCMGVGGAFDYLAGRVRRAPLLIQKIGLEWLFRLLVQPWRWKRQLRLVKFAFLLLAEWKKKF